MSSTLLKEKIAGLEAELARLRELETNPPVLPEGFVAAEVVDTNSTQLGHNDDVPGDWEDAFVVVPQELGDKVTLTANYSGIYAEAAGGTWWTGYDRRWSVIPEEAVMLFLEQPGHWVG